MLAGKKISVVFPCRNEASHLKQVLAKVPEFVDEIIVVSNKSTDNTVSEAKKLGAVAVEENRTINGIGYGYAHITGIKKATGDIIIGADGDGTYPVEQLKEIITHFLKHDYGFLSCNRHPLKDQTKIPLMLRFGVWALNTEVKLLYRHNINDILSGMWLIDSRVKNKLNLTMGEWNLSPQIKINAARHPHIKFGEFHIIQHQRHGESHQNYWKTGISHAWWIFKNRLKMPKLIGSSHQGLVNPTEEL